MPSTIAASTVTEPHIPDNKCDHVNSISYRLITPVSGLKQILSEAIAEIVTEFQGRTVCSRSLLLKDLVHV